MAPKPSQIVTSSDIGYPQTPRPMRFVTPPLRSVPSVVCPPAPKKPSRKPQDLTSMGKPIPAPRFVEHRSKRPVLPAKKRDMSKVTKMVSNKSKARNTQIPASGVPPRRSERLMHRKLRLAHSED